MSRIEANPERHILNNEYNIPYQKTTWMGYKTILSVSCNYLHHPQLNKIYDVHSTFKKRGRSKTSSSMTSLMRQISGARDTTILLPFG